MPEFCKVEAIVLEAGTLDACGSGPQGVMEGAGSGTVRISGTLEGCSPKNVKSPEHAGSLRSQETSKTQSTLEACCPSNGAPEGRDVCSRPRLQRPRPGGAICFIRARCRTSTGLQKSPGSPSNVQILATVFRDFPV